MTAFGIHKRCIECTVPEGLEHASHGKRLQPQPTKLMRLPYIQRFTSLTTASSLAVETQSHLTKTSTRGLLHSTSRVNTLHGGQYKLHVIQALVMTLLAAADLHRP